MGWILFQGGITKLVTYLDASPENNWTAAGYLPNVIPVEDPLTGFFAAMAGNPLIDMLNLWGLTLTGLGLSLDALVRWNAFWGGITMLFYGLAALQGGLLAGLPPNTAGSSTTTSSTSSCCSVSTRSAPVSSSGSTPASNDVVRPETHWLQLFLG
jgi:hypothetical protein